MADTTFIKREIEPYVREWLSKEFAGHKFEERPLPLSLAGGIHKFDAVSEDKTIVGNILSSRRFTRTGRENTGGRRKLLNDIQFLSLLPQSIQLILVFTDGDFCALARRQCKRLGQERIRTLVCPLPKQLQARLTKTLNAASQEQRAANEPHR